MAKKKSSKSRSDSEENHVDFETSLAEVEQIVARLEGGELDLTESLEQYESGIKHLKRCHALLDAAQQRVSVLSGFDADGNPVTEPMSDFVADNDDDPKLKSSRSPERTTSADKGDSNAAGGGNRGQNSVDDAPGLF